MHRINELLTHLENLKLNEVSDLLEIRALVGHRSSEIRLRAIEKLRDLPLSKISRELENCLADKDDLVVSEAIEIIAEKADQKFCARIFPLLEHDKPLVRQAAAFAVSKLRCSRVTSHLRRRLHVERFGPAKASIVYSLIFLEGKSRKHWLRELTTMLTAKNYRTRCVVANLLREGNISLLRTEQVLALKNQLEVETTAAAKSSIKGALKQLKSVQR